MVVVPQCYQLDVNQMMSVQMSLSLWAKNICFYGKDIVAKHILDVCFIREDAS